MTAGGTALAATSAEAIAVGALSSGGASVTHVATISIEPRGGAAVTAVAASLDGAGPDATRVVYVDESVDPAGVWVHPDDPRLPALATAVFPEALGVLLSRVGLPGGVEAVELVAYRPGRRAVVRAHVDGAVAYVKVVRPDRVEAIAARHRAFADAGVPVPRVLGWSPAGLLVLAPAAGTPLESVVADVEPAAVIREIDRLRGRIAEISGMPGPSRPSVASRADWYAARLAGRMPQLAERLRPLVDAAQRGAAASARTMTVHGDLHAGQVFIADDGRSVSGVIDIDTAAPGDPGVDAGAFVAHARASAGMAARAGDRAREAGFRALADAAESSWLGRPRDAGRAHAVGHLLAQAMQAACARDDADGATELIDAAARLAGGIQAGSPAHEDALTEPSPAAHARPGT